MKDQRVHLSKGQIILKENEVSAEAYLVIRGQVAVFLRCQHESGIIPLGLVRAGEVLGEMGVIADLPRSAEAVALGDVELLRIPRSSLEDELEKMPPWVQSMVRSLTERIAEMDNRLRSGTLIDKELLEKINQVLADPSELTLAKTA